MNSSRYPWLLVALLWVVACLNYLDRQVIFSVFPLLRAEMHLDDVQLGLLSTVFLWVYGLASPLGGFLADRFGRKRVIVLSLLIWTVVTLLTGYVRSFGELLAARAVMGLSEACYLPAALALIADVHGGKSRSFATGVHQSGLYAGVALGGVTGGFMGAQYGWRSPFLLLGIIGLVYVVIIQRGIRREEPLPETATPARSPFLAVLSEVIRLPGYPGMLTAFTATSIANWVVYTWLPLFIFERFQLGLASAGFSATFYLQVASFGGILAGGWLADRWSQSSPQGRVLTQTLGLIVMAPFLFLVGFTSSLAVLITALLVYGLGRGLYDCNTMPVLSQVARPEVRATGYGVFNLVGCVVGGTMAAVAGALKPIIGISGALQASAALLLLSAIALLLVGRAIAASRPLVRT